MNSTELMTEVMWGGPGAAAAATATPPPSVVRLSSATPTPPPLEVVGRLFDGRYELHASVGQGGMGVVYRAWDRRVGRVVALKVVHDRGSVLERQRERFFREARVLAALRHRSIPQIYEAGEADGKLYLTCELLEGETLEAATQRGVDLTRRIAAVRDAADALAHAHARGVIHRDVKPQNIILCRDRSFLIDFGLAKGLDRPCDQITQVDALIGTPAYMAPEQLDPGVFGPESPRSDVRGLGATLYYCLTGRPAVRTENGPYAAMMQVVHEDPPPPSEVADGVPAPLDAVCRLAMERDPRRRISTAAFANTLGAWLRAAERGDPRAFGAGRARPSRKSAAIPRPQAAAAAEAPPEPAAGDVAPRRASRRIKTSAERIASARRRRSGRLSWQTWAVTLAAFLVGAAALASTLSTL